jgi:hypothetical protein
MKLKYALIGAAALAAAALSACGDHEPAGSGSVSMPPTMPTKQSLDSAEVLALALKSSEVTTPIEVNDGQLTLTDTSDTAEAISVNGL